MEKKEKKAPLTFTCKASEIRFPDICLVDEKGKKERKIVKFLTFPNWIHDVYLVDKIYKVLGKDLQIGMPISICGEIFPIIEIKDIYYHGIIREENHPIGYPGDTTNLKKYSFKRVVKKNIDNWVIEEIKNTNTDLYFLDKENLNSLSKEDLIKHILNLQKSYDLIKNEYNISLNNLKDEK